MSYETSGLGARIGVFYEPKELQSSFEAPDTIPDDLSAIPEVSLGDLNERLEQGVAAQDRLVKSTLDSQGRQPYYMRIPEGGVALYAEPPVTREEAGRLALLLVRKFNNFPKFSLPSRRPILGTFIPDLPDDFPS